MELRRNPYSEPRKISIINTTGQELKIIFDKGTLPITFRKKLLPAHIPAKIIRRQEENDGSLLQIPEHLRTNFSYGLFVSATSVLQILPLHKTDLHDNSRQPEQQRLRMASDFSNAETFHVISCEAPNIKSEPIPILDGKTYCIALDRLDNQNQKIIVEPIE